MACEDIAARISVLQAKKDASERGLDLIVNPKALGIATKTLDDIKAQIATEEINLANCLAGITTPKVDTATVSLTCLINALSPFIPGPLNVIPVGIIDEWLDPPRLLAKATASNFGLQRAEFPIFDAWWKLSESAKDLHESASGEIDDEISEAWGRLAAIVNDKAEYTELGYRHVLRMSGEGRFVIFSDHHMAFPGSRQDFFQTSGNMKLYSAILDDYADAGFTLIENGDVEELIIHEPMAPPPPAEREGIAPVTCDNIAARISDLESQKEAAERDLDLVINPKALGLTNEHIDRVEAQLATERINLANCLAGLRPPAWRLVQLAQVIGHHQELYEQINRKFVDQDRYIRIAGNHDQDNQDERFLEKLRSVYPKLEQVYDFVIIEPSEASDATFVVGHGHHFDTTSTPKYARLIGEVLSECLGWAYQGADRVWRWDGVDGVQRWANGGEPFVNTLVTDDPDSVVIAFDGDAAFTAGLVAALVAAGAGAVLAAVAAAAGVAAGAAGLAGELSTSDFWEDRFKANIAWEYFQSDDPGVAVFNEVLCGKRWFKFRHLDEVSINGQLEKRFGSRVPYLVLGHSHEPRHRSWNRDTIKQADHYLNSGSAGRFGNLIWCVEIIDGVPQVVAWHRPGGPDSLEAPERRTYTPDAVGGAGRLTASAQHVPLPPVDEDVSDTWLAPVLHMMMSQP